MTSLTAEYRLCDLIKPPKITGGLDAMVDRLIGRAKRRKGITQRLREDVEKVDALGGKYRDLTDAALQARFGELRDVFRRQRKVEEHLFDALAAIREGSARSTGMRPFAVQLMGALAMHRGFLPEMATGEGKSLTASLAAILGGWTGRPCHVITVNDYLAERDAKHFSSFYEFCGLKSGSVTGTMASRDRALGHEADITYTTSKEIVADFLRDRLCLGDLQNGTRWMIRRLWKEGETAQQGLVMRGLHSAIVDEADSVLIDEAVTPLIISGSAGNDGSEQAFQRAWSLASRLEPGVDYRANERSRDVELLPPGLHKVEAYADRLPGLWRASSRLRSLIEQALTAREFFENGKQYVVQDGEVMIVDEFTGRLMPGRKWQHGLHQSIEAKEGVEVSALDETLARMSFQRFFRLFRKLSGMTGTGAEAADEFWHIYRLPVIAIPTNRTRQRLDLPDRVFADDEAKQAAIVEEIVRMHATGRPLLVGTRSIASSETLAAQLQAQGLEISLLNATRHSEEAQIVGDAGQRGKITIATNMAGRGTDVKLGPGVAELGGLHVLATERHESARVDRQLQGRAGRQGDPGSSQAFVSAKDDLLTRFIPHALQNRLESAVRQQLPGSGKLAEFAFSHAQQRAQRRAFQQRRQVLELDSWLAEALSFTGASNE